MAQEYHIYGLVCPLTNQLHYIGCTADPVTRLSAHISEPCRESKNKKHQWILSLRDKNLKPEMFIIEVTNYDNRFECEYFWMDYFQMVGADLFNIYGVFKNYKTQKYTRSKNIKTITPTNEMVKPLREKLGLSQGQFARKIRTTRKIVDMWESGKFYFASDVTIKLFVELYRKTNKGESK